MYVRKRYLLGVVVGLTLCGYGLESWVVKSSIAWWEETHLCIYQAPAV
jgi:hypothetical protein